MEPALFDAAAALSLLSVAAVDLRDALIGQLQRRFPATCPGHVEDAVDLAIVVALEDTRSGKPLFTEALRRDGPPGLGRLLRRVAWCNLWGHLRRWSVRSAICTESLPEHADESTPERELTAAELRLKVERGIDLAARRHARRAPEPLLAALRDRLESGDPDTVVAARHDVRRETLNTARNWLVQYLET